MPGMLGTALSYATPPKAKPQPKAPPPIVRHDKRDPDSGQYTK